MPTQQYFNGAYMEEAVHDITTKIRQSKKTMACTNKEEVEGSFNKNISEANTIHDFFQYNIFELDRNLEGILDEGTYRTTIYNMHKLGWKSQYFKSADVSMLVHGCGV